MTAKSRAPLAVPASWGLTQLVLHFEGEDLSREADPFAGTIVVQLRMDVTASDTPAAIAEQDLIVLREALPKFALAGRGDTQPGLAAPWLDFTHDDEDGRALEQLVIYLRRGRHLYTVTGTHLSARFAKVRPDVVAFAASLST